MKTFLLVAAIAASAAMPASAVTVVGATRVVITNAQNDYLQVAELQAFNFGGTNVALAANGGSAVGTGGTYDPYATADKAIDGNTGGNYYTDTIFHPLSIAGGSLTVNFAAPTTLSSLTLYGRTDCCMQRDLFNYTIYSASDVVLASGQINSRFQVGTVSFDAPSTVPEPQSWALLVAGFGLVGVSMRRRKAAVAAA